MPLAQLNVVEQPALAKLQAMSRLGVNVATALPEHECKVLSGFTGVAVQSTLFLVCVSTLLLKWWLEQPRRKLPIFFLDSSKQIVGAGVIHALNLICAMAFTSFQKSAADECAWYWVNIMIDTTFGVGVCWMLLKSSERMFGYSSGYYGKETTGIDWEEQPDYGKWLRQILMWCGIVATMKMMVVAVMYTFAPTWESISMNCTNWITNATLRLVFVMIVTPVCMNMFQFWVTDSFLKYKKLKSDAMTGSYNSVS